MEIALTRSPPESPSAARHKPPLRLDAALPGRRHVVTTVEAPAHMPQWAHWLEEIGFLPGEEVMLMTRAALGGDPLVVRVGLSTFALRAAEAACIHIAAA